MSFLNVVLIILEVIGLLALLIISVLSIGALKMRIKHIYAYLGAFVATPMFVVFFPWFMWVHCHRFSQWVILLFCVGVVCYFLSLFLIYLKHKYQTRRLKRQEEEKRKLAEIFKETLKLNVTVEGLSSLNDEIEATRCLNTIPECERQLGAAIEKSDKRVKRIALFNERLKAFCHFSLKSECIQAPEEYKVFENALSECNTADSNSLRHTIFESSYISGGKNEVDKMVDGTLAEIEKAKFDRFAKLLTEIGNTNESGAEKGKQAREVYWMIVEEKDHLVSYGEKIREALVLMRVAALHNSYLMKEVQTYLMQGEGMFEDVTEKSFADLQNFDFDLNLAYFDGFETDFESVVENAADNYHKIDRVVKEAGVNMGTKGKAITGLISVGAAWFEEKSRKDDAGIEYFNQIVQATPELTNKLQKVQAQLYDAVKIFYAIENANKVFVLKYAPFRKALFEDINPQTITREQFADLMQVCNLYNSISTSKIKG